MSRDLKGLRVLVTGGNGFLGAFVNAALTSRGAKVMSVSRRTGYDLRNESEMLSAYLLAKPDTTVHLAVSRGTGKNPAGIYRDNFQMGLNVLHASALAHSNLIILADESMYPAHPAIRPTSPYGSAMCAVHDLSRAYREQYHLRSSILVSTELYGIGIAPGGFIPMVAQLLDAAQDAKQDKVEVFGAIEDPRPLLHAADAAEAIAEACAAELDESEPLNLASAEPEMRAGGVVEAIAKRIGYSGSVGWHQNGIKHMQLVGDFTKEALGWAPKILFKDGLEETIGWMKNPEPEVKS